MQGTTTASDQAPPLSSIARANRERPDSIKGWLMNPHTPMQNIMLSRQQIADVIAYLNKLPTR
jgi:mono/diheme cytochrome c family protein